MKDIKILGGGCAKCDKLEDVSRKAAEELGMEFILEKVKDINQIMDYGVMVTPALVVDGKVKVSGKVPSVEDVKKILAN